MSESFSERVERERRETSALISEFVAKLQSLDLPGWIATPDKSEDDQDPYAVTFNHAGTGASFYVTLPGRYASRNGKVSASASWPRDVNGNRKGAREWGLIGYNDSDPYSIGFSYTKTAKAIASDLKRRLIPGVLEGMATINAKLAEQRESQNVVDHDVKKLCKALKNADVREQTHYHAEIYFGGGHARLSTWRKEKTGKNSVDLKIDNVTVEQAIAIAKILNK